MPIGTASFFGLVLGAANHNCGRDGFSRTIWHIHTMNLHDRFLKIDALLVAPHRTLNQIAVGQAVDLSVVHAAIAAITEARDILTDLAEAPDSN